MHDHIKLNIMALHFAAKPKPNADKGLRWARIESQRKTDKVGLGNIDVERDFSDVRDVVRAYRGLLEASPRGTFNVCSERVCSLRDVLALTKELSGHSTEIRVNPAFVRANEVRRLRGSAKRLRSVIPTWSSRPIRETLAWMLAESNATSSGQ